MFKRMAAALLGLLALLAVFLLASRFWPASAMQKQAREALEQPLDWPGANAWALLETLDHDELDMAQRQAMVDARVEAFAHWAQSTAAQRYGDGSAVEDVPAVPELAVAPPAALPALEYCRYGSLETCLATVRFNPEGVAADIQARAGLIRNIARLADFEHARSPYLADIDSPMLSTMGRLPTPLAAHALAHVQGNSTAALDGLCRDMGSARMLASQSDNLFLTVAGARWLQANGQLLAHVLAELPADVTPPASCKVGLQILPPAAISLCRPLQGQYAMNAAVNGHHDATVIAEHPVGSWLFDLEKTLNRQAASLGAACQMPLQQRIAQDLPVDGGLAPAEARSPWHIECATNYIGCVLSAIAAPAYDKFIVRMQDVAASQRLLGAWLWLREQPAGGDVAAQLSQLPQELRSAHRPVQLSADGTALEVARYYTGEGNDLLQLPLPAADKAAVQ